jgi:hypothetical protein
VSTTRLGGGVSARLVALTVVVVLVGVVAVALGGRPPTRDLTARASFSPVITPTPAGQPTDGQAATPAVVIALPRLEPVQPSALLGHDAVTVIAQIEGQTYLAPLYETDPGRLTGTIRAPFLAWSEAGNTLELAQLWPGHEQLRSYISLGSWPLNLAALRPDVASATPIMHEVVAARRLSRPMPRAVSRGYTLTVSVESHLLFGMVIVEVQLGPARERGGDGIMGRLAFPPQSAPPMPTRVAEPAVPLILLTATPWHPQRANRPHGESWVGGF